MGLQNKMMCDSNTFDVIIIGAGPSSFATCIYLDIAGYKVAYIEKNIPGGKLVNIPLITNYPGYKQISGADLALNIYEQAQKVGVISLFGEVSQIVQYLNYHVVYSADGAKRYTKALVIDTGTVENKLEAKDANKYEHKGVSYCAICDGPLTKDKDVIVIGSGDLALSNAIYLSKICNQVYLVVRLDQFRLKYFDLNLLKQTNNIKIIFNSLVDTILGDGNKVTGAIIKDVNTNNQQTIGCSYIFNCTSLTPATNYLRNTKLLDRDGNVLYNQKMKTNVSGIYAIGDVTNNQFKQITIVISDGTIAALNIVEYLNN